MPSTSSELNVFLMLAIGCNKQTCYTHRVKVRFITFYLKLQSLALYLLVFAVLLWEKKGVVHTINCKKRIKAQAVGPFVFRIKCLH